MRDKKQPLDLSSLTDDYEIVGELDVRGTARAFRATRKGATGKRKDDQTGVLIEVVKAPAGDEANALSHLAADTQLLVRLRHRRLIPVLEGRWIGTDAFAVVTPRITDPSLAQMLEQGEEFSNPRAAAILRDVNGLLEWAREQKIVHRNVIPDRIYLEPKTDRVRVSFVHAPIQRLQTSDRADADARTIGRLALAMLTGTPDPGSSDDESLGELRPDLPAQLIQSTATLLAGQTSGTDVAAYIALVGMAEPLFAGETEAERIRAEILEEQRMEREKLAAERAEFERSMEQERQKLATEQEDQQRKLAEEREELLRRFTEEREELLRMVAEERTALVATRDELERAAADRRAELERAAAEDRQRLADLRASIERAGEREVEKKRAAALDEISDAESTLDEGELATPPLALPVGASLQPLTFEPLTFEPPTFGDQVAPETTHDASAERNPNRRRWIVTGALGVAAVLVVVAFLVMGGRFRPGTLGAKPAASPIVSTAPVTAPVTAPYTPAVPLPTPASQDASSGALAPSSGTPAASSGALAPSPDSPRVVTPVVRRRPSVTGREPTVRETPVRETPVRRDSVAATPHDILSRVPGAAVPKPDTVAPRDSNRRPDTSAGLPPGNPPV